MTSVTFNGEEFESIQKLCKKYNAHGSRRDRIYKAVKDDMDIGEAIKDKRHGSIADMDAIRKAADESGIKMQTLRSRLRSGMTLDDAVLKPVGKSSGKKIKINSVEYASIAVAARDLGLSYSTLIDRIKAGWSDSDLVKPKAIVDHSNLGPIKPGRYRGENDYNRVMDYIEQDDDDENEWLGW